MELEPGSVVVGADGTFSKVRPIVTDERPRYTGETARQTARVEATTRQAREDSRHTWLQGRGGWRASGLPPSDAWAVAAHPSWLPRLPRRALTLAGCLGLNEWCQA